MHSTSFIHFLAAALTAGSTVNAFQIPGSNSGVTLRAAGAVMAVAVPALAAPVEEGLVAREPHHQGKTAKAGKKAKKAKKAKATGAAAGAATAGATPAANAARMVTGTYEDITDNEKRDDLEARHHQGKTGGKKAKAAGAGGGPAGNGTAATAGGKKKAKKAKAAAAAQARDLFVEDEVEEDGAELEAREPHHQGKTAAAGGKTAKAAKKGKKAKATGAAAGAAAATPAAAAAAA